jgi:hypothetical protein
MRKPKRTVNEAAREATRLQREYVNRVLSSVPMGLGALGEQAFEDAMSVISTQIALAWSNGFWTALEERKKGGWA